MVLTDVEAFDDVTLGLGGEVVDVVVDLEVADAAAEPGVGGQLVQEPGRVPAPPDEHRLPERDPREQTLQHQTPAQSEKLTKIFCWIAFCRKEPGALPCCKDCATSFVLGEKLDYPFTVSISLTKNCKFKTKITM